MNFHILTLFPDMVMQGLHTSIIGRAMENGLLSVEAVNIRDYTLDKHKKVDDYPYGGGAGMLMQAQPVYDAWKSVADRAAARPRTVYLTPQGQTFTQALAKELATEQDLVLLCGHYEGIDERVLEEIVTDYVSIGDYVLTGGELPAMVLVDAVSRMVPGVLTNEESGQAESFEGNLLEYPQYSRPEEWMGKRVPSVLLSGNQRKINEWRRNEAVERTRERRPDLYEKYEKLEHCRMLLAKQKLLHIDMTELIVRGQAKLIYAEGETICLQDAASGIYFHTASDPQEGRRSLEHLPKTPDGMFVFHQEFMVEIAREMLDLEPLMECYQAVYTRKEKLPVSGLFAGAGNASLNQKIGLPEMRRLDMRYFETVCAQYKTVDDPDYIRDRIEKGRMYGAFVDGELAGFAGIHTEGGIGMLEVFEAYRRRKIATALETYIMNLSLEQGMTPYGQVQEKNEASMRLQESLGLCFSRQKVYWMESRAGQHPEKL